MHITMVTGFLGSGKTTFILEASRFLAANNKRFSVIVNEMGRPGVDNKLLKQMGADVRELLGGCICCSAAGDFRRVIEEFRWDDEPDFVLVEPSGIADPAQVYESLSQGLAPKDTLTTAALLDSERIDLILEAAGPLAESSASLAQTIVITKTDIAPEKGILAAEAYANKIHPQARVFKTPFPASEGESVIREALGWKK